MKAKSWRWVRFHVSADKMVAASLERPWKQNDARLVLEDGSVWHGVAFGDTEKRIGEVVFNTSLTGCVKPKLIRLPSKNLTLAPVPGTKRS